MMFFIELCGLRVLAFSLSYPSSGLGMSLYQKFLLHFVFGNKTMVNSRKDKYPGYVKHPFLSPLQGLLYYSIYQGFHPWLYPFSPSGLL